jgi:hypothetical protein
MPRPIKVASNRFETTKARATTKMGPLFSDTERTKRLSCFSLMGFAKLLAFLAS